MIIYPAIDIRRGRCVRLVEGDFERETLYDADPTAAASRWVDAGARWLHVVDLDGAVAGRPVNVETVRAIRKTVPVPVQLGGGLRCISDIEAAFDAGINRAILGTVALKDPALVREAVDRWGDAIAVGLDARNGFLATDGWLGQSDARAIEVAERLAEAGVQHFIFTDISRDGTLSGPNLEALKELTVAVERDIIASGGVSSLADIQGAAASGAGGAIIGRAIYDGRVNLQDAIAIADTDGTSS